MGDSVKSPVDKTPKSPLKPRTVRSQKALAISPTDLKPDPDENEEPSGSGRPLPRSHTPGHLSSKSQDRRRKPSELSIRQRSQSASQPIVSFAAKAPSNTSLTPTAIPATATGTKPPPLQALQTTNLPNGGVDDGKAGDVAASAVTESRDKDGKRPPALRSTSAIASKPVLSSSATARHVSNTPRATRAEHMPFPPLQDPNTAVDVPAAPSSGMYWSRAPVSGSPHTPLRAHTTALIGSNIYIFGGCDSRACFNELYVLDADSFYWSKPIVSGDVPPPLRAMTCTQVGKKLVVFGGGDGPSYSKDVYVFDTISFRWSRPRIVGEKSPSKRRAHTACLYKNGIYVFGGGDGVKALNDIWRLDVSDTNKMSWKLVYSEDRSPPASGGNGKDSRPKARGYHTANMVGGKLIVYGGSDGGECFNDVWVYDVDTNAWKAVNIPVTYRRLAHTATLVGSYLFVIGGHDGSEYSNELLLLNLVTMTWDKRRVYGLPPSGRGYHGTVLYDSRLLCIGGFDGSEVFGDVWILELAVHAYYSQISHFTIEV